MGHMFCVWFVLFHEIVYLKIDGYCKKTFSHTINDRMSTALCENIFYGCINLFSEKFGKLIFASIYVKCVVGYWVARKPINKTFETVFLKVRFPYG